MEVPTTEALSDWSSTLSEISYTAFVHSVAGVHLAASAFQLYRTMLSPAPRDPRDWGWADFRNVGSRIVTITWAIVGLWLSLFASAGRWALPLLILLTHIGSWSPRLLVWLLVFAPWLACKLAVRGGLRLAALPLRVAWRLSQLFPQCEPVTLYHPHPGGTVYQDMCVSVYSIFSVERTSRRGTPHYIGLRGYSTGGRYADAIGLGG